jgi:hypothetical protein
MGGQPGGNHYFHLTGYGCAITGGGLELPSRQVMKRNPVCLITSRMRHYWIVRLSIGTYYE